MKVKIFSWDTLDPLSRVEADLNQLLSSGIVVKQTHQTSAGTRTSISILYEDKDDKVKKEKEELLNSPLSVLMLSARSQNRLQDCNVTTVRQLCEKSEEEIVKFRNFSRKCLSEVKERLHAAGLSLGMKF